ncbi:hypothetical protein DAPPUDRAFT_305336 [Daphnia pulex]|uniref:Uncharacterized protein n=1 Tax=Daphnia pulex TaxID=6669 RepID=E9GRX1_DAPPU|nr:hypothetical protein DAPPUDRAFT_305336 [Daphnia pulex]|eukprot:EFX77603.1 hypothetical protein DAPPUDRAFT_305336 [Daphnia pulex]
MLCVHPKLGKNIKHFELLRRPYHLSLSFFLFYLPLVSRWFCFSFESPMCVCVFFNLAHTQTIGELRRSARTTFENGNSYLARIAVCMSPYLFALDGIISSDGVFIGIFIFSADSSVRKKKI